MLDDVGSERNWLRNQNLDWADEILTRRITSGAAAGLGLVMLTGFSSKMDDAASVSDVGGLAVPYVPPMVTKDDAMDDFS